MSYEVVFAATARRSLRKVPPRIIPAVVEFVYGAMASNPRRVGKRLKGEFDGCYGARRGPYRMIYGLDEPARRVEILKVEHRADVYRPR